MAQKRQPRVRAPELVGRGGWLNTGGVSYSLKDFRGRFCLLDFWTFCCINCLHVIEELRDIETKYADVLVVVGVHSPKFAHEADHGAVTSAVERYEVDHPVLDDPELVTWDAYGVRAWPTLALVDPEGYVVAQFSGEGHAHAISALLDELIVEHDRKQTLHRGDGPYRPPAIEPSTLRFPAKVVMLAGGTLLVADAGHHSIAELAADGETLLRRIGSGGSGFLDGAADEAAFNEPNGLCLLPGEVAARVGYDVVVADTANHALRGVSLDTGRVRTVAGTGRQWMRGDELPQAGPPAVALSSPWDVVWNPEWAQVAVAMAGIHQVWSFDPIAPSITARAGTTNEGLRDGPEAEAWFAQTSGLAVESTAAEGARLWLVDSETSSLRSIRGGVVMTHVGQGLFDFGHRDGPAQDALFQHPLGVVALPDGSLAVLDTYNGAVRRFDPADGESGAVSTLLTGLAEPSGGVLVAAPDGRQDLLVAESAAHRLTRVRLPDAALHVEPTAFRTRRPPVDLAPGPVELVVVFDPPSGQKLDDRDGPGSRLLVSASPAELLMTGAGSGTELFRELTLDGAIVDGVLHVAAFAASCDEVNDEPGIEQYPACHVHQQDWGIPVRLTPGGDRKLVLVLGGMDRPNSRPTTPDH